MIYRRLSTDGDYVLGAGNSTFLSGTEATAQAIVTRIKLLWGEWWENINMGTPLWQSILGTPGSDSNLKSIDNILRSRILSLKLGNTNLIKSIDEYSHEYNHATRSYLFKATVTTIYNNTPITIEQEFTRSL